MAKALLEGGIAEPGVSGQDRLLRRGRRAAFGFQFLQRPDRGYVGVPAGYRGSGQPVAAGRGVIGWRRGIVVVGAVVVGIVAVGIVAVVISPSRSQAA